ncbi:TatD family hydrolase [Oceanobacillus polygoni]|uniref:TatD DNase family protein n=1 Tax=Oceanobacillus polygoni TaxID=1235259 RepID=A0A9X0YQ25_9BACI|nr:TatD family hydrolase [Oceanobacillus polygoni]MBP2076988.1 TatD DNase family protein [Oceanobacillus polygoni]
MRKLIDSHIHFDNYEEVEQKEMLRDLHVHNIEAIISVSNHLQSAKRNLTLAKEDSRILPAFGYHPEQKLPTDNDIKELLEFNEINQQHMIAVGEVGLPYYLRQKHPKIVLEGYIELLEQFIQQAVKLNKPIVLHAVYEDAPIVCSLLEKHNVKHAHFHWFKGDQQAIERMKQNNYYISVTPDVVYKKKIQQLVQSYPITQLMVETDGPWPFEGRFEGQRTHPKMMHRSIATIAALKQVSLDQVYQTIYENTCRFYGL